MNEKYMERALELAEKGAGYVNPNPQVGAVIVKDGSIIGEGYHKKYTEAHAEINAINSATEDVSGATMYITLEPCSHYGKTPPCANALIKHKIKKVIIAMQDPNPIVSGNGIKILRNNGIEVITDVLKEKAMKLNEIFIKYITTKEPFCIIKTAMTLDGKIATTTGDSKWITNEKSREEVHKIRHKVAAVMVGVETVIKDNPQLTARLKNANNPMRIIVDTYGRTPLNANALDTNAKTIIATTTEAEESKINELKIKGAEIIQLPPLNGKVPLKQLMQELGKRKIDSILIEGGGTLNYSALKEKIADKIMFFISPKIIGGKNAPTPVDGEGKALINNAIKISDMSITHFDSDIMISGYIKTPYF